MGLATFAVGLLPTYAQVGSLATVLLVFLRLVQGLAVGGEWGGSVLVAVEHAPAHRRTLYGSFAQLGSSGGALLSTGAFALVSGQGHDALSTWGWRVPFLVSIVLVVIGLVIRLRLEESPVLLAMRRNEDVARLPVVEAFQTSWRQVLLGVGALAIGIGGYYVVTSFLLTYGTVELKLPEHMLLTGLTVAAVVEFLVTPWLSLLGDHVGAR
ncbi:MAG: MFS transporter, partial [Streptosporangiales bacterium]